MSSFSVRDHLPAAAETGSLRQSAHESGQSFPLSVRTWLGAYPPGRIVRKEISLDLLQHKFDVIFNDRPTPLFKLTLHGDEMKKGKLEISFDEPGVGYRKFAEPKDLGELWMDVQFPLPNTSYRFDDLNTDRITVSLVPSQPLGIEVQLHFETEGVELRLEQYPNVDFVGFYILLKLKLDRNEDGEIDPLSNLNTAQASEVVQTNVAVDVDWLPDGYIGDKVESNIISKVFDKLKEDDDLRSSLRKKATAWLVGGDFYVIDVTTDDESLFIKYVLPPGHLEPFPEEIQPPLDPGPLANIEHIVVLMMENRSFDHMLGYLSKHPDSHGNIRQDIDGLRGGEKNHYHGKDYVSFTLLDTVFKPGPCHEYHCVEDQTKGGTMGGFVEDYAQRAEEAGISPGAVMGYHTADHVPVYDALAHEFLICQRWFAAHPGPTFPNRFYTVTGRLNRDVYGRWEQTNPEHEFFVPTWETNIFDHLSAQGVSWRYYEHEYGFLRLFARYTTDNDSIIYFKDPMKGFVASAGAGTLPAVTFIDPNFSNISNGNDDQPPADIARGQHLIGEVVHALINSPLWGKTLLIITYDEHGGFYDHVTPPTAPAVSTVGVYGVRVPAFVVSPWVDKAKVSDVVFDHTSILKTIIRRFLSAHPPDMGERVAKAKDLSLVLRSTARTEPLNIPVPPEPPINTAHATNAEQPTEGERDFNALLRSVRDRYPKD